MYPLLGIDYGIYIRIFSLWINIFINIISNSFIWLMDYIIDEATVKVIFNDIKTNYPSEIVGLYKKLRL